MSVLTESPSTRFPAAAAAFASGPPEQRGLERDLVRLLVGRADGLAHARFRDLPDHLHPGDLVVVNDSATTSGQVDAVAEGRGAVVVHVAGRRGPTWLIELRTSPDAADPLLDARPGQVVRTGDVRLTLTGPHGGTRHGPHGFTGNRLWRATAKGDLAGWLRTHGRPIAYGYLDRAYDLSTYQTVFATRPGSAEMPSAGRPFTPELVTRLVARGIGVAPVTLHTGVSSQEAGEAPQDEWFEVPRTTARLVRSTREAGGRVVAVGTTVTRALESAVDDRGRIAPRSGWTDRVVTPADPPQVVDGLVTGWHDPLASHLLLVEAVAGPELTQAAYDAASAAGYLWHEFGDAALLLPDHGPRTREGAPQGERHRLVSR